jgi:CRP-like cAMP-binding protein
MLEQLRNYLTRFVQMTDQEFEQLSEHVSIRRCKARERITDIGQTENYLNFILKGVMRKFFINGKEEIVTQFGKEGELICASVSFFTRQPSFFVIEGIEACTFASINFTELDNLMRKSYRFEQLGRLIIIEWLVNKTRWEYLRIQVSPKERFARFLQTEPELLKRVPQKYLATFLSIKPETFSRYKSMSAL